MYYLLGVLVERGNAEKLQRDTGKLGMACYCLDELQVCFPEKMYIFGDEV